MLKWAKLYAQRGWHVLPIHTPTDDGCSCIGSCQSPGKHPRTRNGVKARSTHPDDLRRWWEKLWPEANIAIACGEVSNLIVLDIDPRNGGDDELARLIDRHGPLPETLTVSTGGGGRHYYFTPNGSTRKRVLARGVDLVGDGGYVVAPPSRHVSGQPYAWEGYKGPALFLEEDVARAPAWLSRVSRRRNGSSQGFDLPSEKELRELQPGHRNVMLTRAAGAMRRWGFSDNVINEALQMHNNEVCSPPLPEDEVRRIAYSISRYEPEVTVENGEDKPHEGGVLSVEDC